MSTPERQTDARLHELAGLAAHTSEAQLRHRMVLVEFWAPRPGDRVLEVGCGQGDTTVVLADAVGPTGSVVAVDTAPPDYGTPTTLGQAHAAIASSPVGKQIDFHTSTDLLKHHWEFPVHHFDLVVFAHCSWYMDSPKQLQKLFARVRPWSKRLGFSEWDPRPENVHQLPHLMAALVQAHVHAYWPESGMGNVSSLVVPEQARSMAERAGWRISKEQTTGSSVALEDGRSWEIAEAIDMAEQMIGLKKSFPESAKEVVAAEARLLSRLAGREPRESLPTSVFLAQ